MNEVRFLAPDIMEIGSIVECVNGSFDAKSIELIANRPKQGKIYTIRGIREYSKLNKTGLLLEELNNEPIFLPNLEGIFEPTFNIERFREIPEMDISELVEELTLTNND